MCLPEILLSNIRLLPDNPKLSPAFPPSTARLHPPPGAFPFTGPPPPASRDGVSATPKSGGLFRRRGRERACSSDFPAATPKSSLVFLRRGPSCAPFATFIKVRKAQNDPIYAFGGQSQRIQRAESVSSGGESEFQKGRVDVSGTRNGRQVSLVHSVAEIGSFRCDSVPRNGCGGTDIHSVSRERWKQTDRYLETNGQDIPKTKTGGGWNAAEKPQGRMFRNQSLFGMQCDPASVNLAGSGLVGVDLADIGLACINLSCVDFAGINGLVCGTGNGLLEKGEGVGEGKGVGDGDAAVAGAAEAA